MRKFAIITEAPASELGLTAEGYTGHVSDAAKRLHDALQIILLTYMSSELRKRAEAELEQM